MENETLSYFFLGLLGLGLFVAGFLGGMSLEGKNAKEAREFCQEFCLKYQPTKECLEKCGR